jgi:hypothetical protein
MRKLLVRYRHRAIVHRIGPHTDRRIDHRRGRRRGIGDAGAGSAGGIAAAVIAAGVGVNERRMT